MRLEQQDVAEENEKKAPCLCSLNAVFPGSGSMKRIASLSNRVYQLQLGADVNVRNSIGDTPV